MTPQCDSRPAQPEDRSDGPKSPRDGLGPTDGRFACDFRHDTWEGFRDRILNATAELRESLKQSGDPGTIASRLEEISREIVTALDTLAEGLGQPNTPEPPEEVAPRLWHGKFKLGGNILTYDGLCQSSAITLQHEHASLASDHWTWRAMPQMADTLALLAVTFRVWLALCPRMPEVEENLFDRALDGCFWYGRTPQQAVTTLVNAITRKRTNVH